MLPEIVILPSAKYVDSNIDVEFTEWNNVSFEAKIHLSQLTLKVGVEYDGKSLRLTIQDIEKKEG